jgi:hypothetical protein
MMREPNTLRAQFASLTHTLMRSRMQAVLWTAILIFPILLFAILAIHQVDAKVSAEDKLYIPKFIGDEYLSATRSQMTYEDELDHIAYVQSSVLTVAAGNQEIPFDTERESKNL